MRSKPFLVPSSQRLIEQLCVTGLAQCQRGDTGVRQERPSVMRLGQAGTRPLPQSPHSAAATLLTSGGWEARTGRARRGSGRGSWWRCCYDLEGGHAVCIKPRGKGCGPFVWQGLRHPAILCRLLRNLRRQMTSWPVPGLLPSCPPRSPLF